MRRAVAPLTGTWGIVIMGRQLPMEWKGRGRAAGIISFPPHNGADQNRAITYVFYSADRGGEIEEERRGEEGRGTARMVSITNVISA